MNRKKRKAYKRFWKRYGKATNPYWQAQSQTAMTDAERMALDDAMREAFLKCLLDEEAGSTFEEWQRDSHS